MIGINCVANVLGGEVLDTIAIGQKLGFEEEFIRDKIGFLSLCKSSGANRTSKLAHDAVRALVTRSGTALDSVDCLVVCTQNPDGSGLPNTSSILHGDLGLSKNCACFDISLGCSGYVFGLSIILSFMQINGLRCGILVTSDPYSKIVGMDDKNTALLFGDGASATLLEPDGAWKIGRGRFGSDGKLRDAISSNATGRLEMNGRHVFAFAVTTVPPLLSAVLEDNGLTANDIDLFAVHQGSKYIVDELRKRLQVEETRMPFVAQNTGNLVSSSIPRIIEGAFASGAKHIAMAGFGVGLSWAANVLTRT